MKTTDLEKAQNLIAAVRNKTATFDKLDKEAGFATPSDVGINEVVKTAKEALMAALVRRNWGAVAEVYVLLDKV